MKTLFFSLRASFTLLLLMTLLLGVIYPLIITGIAQTMFVYRSNGSLIERADKVRGSNLLGQEFTSPGYFWGRLSATTPAYNPAASAGSNLNPGNPKWLELANARISALHKLDPKNTAPVPIDLVTASASGVDPHISIEAMQYQLPRVARIRGVSEETIQSLVAKATEKPLFGLFCDPYINVVKLNLAMDEK